MIVWSHLTAGLAWNASTSTRKAQKSGFPWFSWFRVGAQGGLGFGKSLTCWSSSRNIGMRMLKVIGFSGWICCCKYAWFAWWMRNRWNVGGICWFIGGPWWDDDDKDDQKKLQLPLLTIPSSRSHGVNYRIFSCKMIPCRLWRSMTLGLPCSHI